MLSLVAPASANNPCGQIYYVSSTGDDYNSGLDWNHAKRHIQELSKFPNLEIQ